MVETWKEYFPYAYVEVMTGSEILQKRNDAFDNDNYDVVRFINKDLEPETTYIIAYEVCGVLPISGVHYIEECIEVYKD